MNKKTLKDIFFILYEVDKFVKNEIKNVIELSEFISNHIFTDDLDTTEERKI